MKKSGLLKRKTSLRRRGMSNNKFGAVKVFADDRCWDSKGEHRRFKELEALQDVGEISELECQVTVHLSRARISYRADFCYTENDRVIYEDYKGVTNPRFNLICQLWKAYGPALLRITGNAGRGRITTKREIMPQAPEVLLEDCRRVLIQGATGSTNEDGINGDEALDLCCRIREKLRVCWICGRLEDHAHFNEDGICEKHEKEHEE